MLAAGNTAPEFSLSDLGGQQHTLAGLLAGGPVLLAIFKSNCPVCQLTLPYLDRIAQGSLRVVGISQDDARATTRFQQHYGLTMPALLDSEEQDFALSNALKITHVPSLFLVEADGVISYAGSGFRKIEIEELARRSGVTPFHAGENVPEWKAG